MSCRCDGPRISKGLPVDTSTSLQPRHYYISHRSHINNNWWLTPFLSRERVLYPACHSFSYSLGPGAAPNTSYIQSITHLFSPASYPPLHICCVLLFCIFPAMTPNVEANSLSDILELAANPPKYPRNPTEKERQSLTLYIARVPGSKGRSRLSYFVVALD